MDNYQNYSHIELIQTVGQLYMDLSRSQIVIRQLQQIIQEKDSIINQQMAQNECRPEDGDSA